MLDPYWQPAAIGATITFEQIRLSLKTRRMADLINFERYQQLFRNRPAS